MPSVSYGVRKICAGLIVVLVSCTAGNETAPDLPKESAAEGADAPIRTDRSRYVLGHGFFGPEVTIMTTLKAPDDRTIYVMNCNGAISTALQRLVDDRWVDAWGALTNSCLSQPIVLAPEQEHSAPMIIRPGAGAVIYPRGNRELIEPGTYRAVWHFVLTSFDINARPFGEDLPLEQRASAPFVIEPPPERPTVITSIEPAEEARVAANSPLRVSFEFSRTAFRLSDGSPRLYVNGNDVTDQIERAGTDDVPPSQLQIVFAPRQGWEAGRHSVKIELADQQGNSSSYSWIFTVVDPR